MKVARSAYVTLKSLIFAKQKATLKIKKLFRSICFWKRFLMKKLAVMAENLFLLQFIMPGFTKVNLSAKLSGKFLDDELLALTMFSK